MNLLSQYISYYHSVFSSSFTLSPLISHPISTSVGSAKKAVAATSGGTLPSGQSKKVKKPNHEGTSSSSSSSTSRSLWSDGDDDGNTNATRVEKTSIVVCTEPWTCGRCTFENKAKVKNCDVCGQPQKEKVVRPKPPPFTFRRDPRIGMEYQMDPEQLPTAQILSKSKRDGTHEGVGSDMDEEPQLRRDDMNCDNELWEVLWLCGDDSETMDESCAVGKDENEVMEQGEGQETMEVHRHEHPTTGEGEHPMNTIAMTTSDQMSGNTLLNNTIPPPTTEFKSNENEEKRDSTTMLPDGETSSPVGSTDMDVISTSTSSLDDTTTDEHPSSTHPLSIHSQTKDPSSTAAAAAAALPPSLSASAGIITTDTKEHTTIPSSSSSSSSSKNDVDKHEKTLQNRSPTLSYLSCFPGHEVQALQGTVTSLSILRTPYLIYPDLSFWFTTRIRTPLSLFNRNPAISFSFPVFTFLFDVVLV